jgi:hypothetical protein
MSAKEHTGADDVLAKIQTYKDDFRSDAEEIHKIILSVSENAYPRLWYGMPGYSKTKTSPVVMYFRKDKYITFGRTESANISFDSKCSPEPVAWFVEKLDDESKKMIRDIAMSVLG